MEEESLLKERLQAITDKRKIREDISHKRRDIEEEKLKLQYIKKKSLREQWLMDGLQSDEERENMKIQAQDELQRTTQLQSNILRMEKEIEELEAQELELSANEENILKRLKEVERTTEDIIKTAALADTSAHGGELNQGCSISENHNSSLSVTMETGEQSNAALEAEENLSAPFEQDVPLRALGEQVYLKNDSPESPGFETLQDLSLPGPPDFADEETKVPDQKVPTTEEGHDVLNRNESTNSSDTLSSADSVYENEAHKKKEPPQVPEDVLEVQLEEQPIENDEQQEFPGIHIDPIDHFPDPDMELFQDPTLEPLDDDFPDPEILPEQFSEHELKQYQAATLYTESILDLDPDLDPDAEQYPDLEMYPGHEAQELDPDDIPDYLKEEQDECEVLFPPSRDESELEQRIREEVASDGSNGSCHELDPEDMEECLGVEIGAASSDSETDEKMEKWRNIFSSSINKEDDDSYLDSLQLSAQELFVQKVEVNDLVEEEQGNIEVRLDVPQMDEVLEQPEEVVSIPVPSQEVKYNLLGIQSLSKISEDDGENGRDANQTAKINRENEENLNNNMETSKKVPKDFCVIQETKSENVSTEHVDFQLARKQWREMEEQTKNKVYIPSTKQAPLHSSHSFMYTPVRHVERTNKKGHNLENLNLFGEYPSTQFSPCSEDSGLGDSSYRSPYEDVETPVEKEIRMSMEREENFKRERGLSRMGKSTDCAPSRGMPRSISTPLTPSFIITSSPTKEPIKRDVSAQNVIIVDPASESSQRLGKDLGACSAEWRSEDTSSSLIILETSNLIIRSASEYSLNKVCEQPEEKIFLSNPFFKLRSRSTISLVDEEIKQAKQREEELKKEREERAELYSKDRFLSNHKDTLSLSFDISDTVKCKSSPSSPMKTAYKMDRSVLSCDHRFPEAYTGVRRKSAMALRWEAGEFNKD
ncbi:hypothetical protein WMY93_030262 [Mugilogobius chulae]|uniref:Palmdelphin n=1 Tax=Mugilogobius chulae TaxID=88201 RepID=A0AAW0MM66_9GOBI